MRTETGKIKTLNFLLMLQHGTIMILWGSVIPEVIDAFSLSEASAGILLGLGTMGAFFGPLLAGPTIDRVGLKLVMLMGFAGEAIFLLMFGAAQWFWMLVLASFIVHICSGFIETAGNVLPNRVNLSNIGSFMSLVHFAFSLGAFIAPFLVGWYIDATGLWRPVPCMIAVPAMLIGLLTVGTRVDGGGRPSAGDARHSAAAEPPAAVTAADSAAALPTGRPFGRPFGGPPGRPLDSPLFFLKTLRNRSVVGGALTLFLYVGSEVGLSSWVVYYLRTSLAFPPFRAASGLSVLWMGLMIGRFANTFLSKHFSSRTLVTASGAIGSAAVLVFLLVSRTISVYLFLTLIGLCMSGVFPNVMAEINHRYPESTGRVTATLAIGASCGAILFQWLIGITAEHSSIAWALLIPAILMAGVSGAFIYTSKTLERA